MSYTDIDLYRGDELIGSIRGDLGERQLQRLCELQRETDDCCGYSGMIRTPEEWEEISCRHIAKGAPESTNLFDVNDFKDSEKPSKEEKDNPPF